MSALAARERLEVPMLATGARVRLEVEPSSFGDYFDFRVRAGDPGELDVIASLSSYANPCRLVEVTAGEVYVMLLVGGVILYLGAEAGATLATFLRLPIEQDTQG